jgi:hypothetical protein
MAENCPDCSNSSQKCDTCFFVAKIDQIADCVQVIVQNKQENIFHGLRAEMEAENPIADKGKETIKQLGELSKDYSQLELKTQRAVRAIQSYGENCEEAAEDFLEDGNVRDLLEELADDEETKKSLQDAVNSLNLIG